MNADNLIDNCDGCGEQPPDCACHGPVVKWGGIKKVTFNAYLPERPIFETINAYVFGDDGQHLHVQLPGDEQVRLIASSKIIDITGGTP